MSLLSVKMMHIGNLKVIQMNSRFNMWGTLRSEESEKEFLKVRWNELKQYTCLTYFLCCLFFLLAGVFGDFQRNFIFGSAKELLVFRIILFIVALVFIGLYRKAQERPKYVELWLDSMKYISTIIILLLTYWTQGTSLTLLPGIMMMLIGFYMILPGRLFSTNICAVVLFVTFTFLQDSSVTYGEEVFRYMVFMLGAIGILLLSFKIRHDKWARKEFLSKKELDSLNKTKDRLMATIGHDIRSPLAITLSRAELTIHALDMGKVDEARNSQETIIRTVHKLDKLLSNIVDWALSDLKEGRDTRDIGCIKNTLEDAIDFVQEQARDKKVEIEKNITPCKYLHDKRMLTTCFRNIISNAIKFNPYNSKIRVEGSSSDGFYHLKCYDEGPGMDNELVEKIKKGINESSSIGSEGEKGSGLGLKLVRNIVEQHDGVISISKNIEGGTNFYVRLPLIGEV